jgi:hypothetical protein
MRQTTTAEVRADEGKVPNYSAPAHSTGWFDRLLRTRRAFTVAQDARRGDPGLAAIRNPGNVGIELVRPNHCLLQWPKQNASMTRPPAHFRSARLPELREHFRHHHRG